jgi:hypothetical protein
LTKAAFHNSVSLQVYPASLPFLLAKYPTIVYSITIIVLIAAVFRCAASSATASEYRRIQAFCRRNSTLLNLILTKENRAYEKTQTGRFKPDG